MKKVLFVCLGNICRSPMAEAVLRHKIIERNLQEKITVDSAGTSNWHSGKSAHEGTLKILQEKGVNGDKLISRQIISDDLEKFDYVVAMDAQNVIDIKKISNENLHNKIIRFLDLVPEVSLKDVPDPYYTGNFEEVYNLVDKASDALISKILND